MATITNGANTPLNARSGSVPNVSGAMQNWFQPMTFGVVTKTNVGFEVVETVDNVSFRGVIQPLSGRDLLIKPEGQRAWKWTMLHSDITLDLKIDSIVTYLGLQYRVMSKKDYRIYGYYYWELVEDYTGAGPYAP